MSTNTLNQFIAQVKNGMARSNTFRVELKLPSALDQYFKDDIRNIILFCDSAQLPGITMMSNQVRSYGEFKEVPYEKTYEPITLSFYVDENLTVRHLFDTWLGLIQSTTTRDFNYPNNYITDKLDIIVNDINENNRYRVSLHNAYPKNIQSVQLDYASKEVMKLSVTFSYQYAISAMLVQQASTDNSTSGYNTQMPNYNYGYPQTTEVPASYLTDFAGYQSTSQIIDSSIGGAKSLTTFENVGELTGFGGIFNQ